VVARIKRETEVPPTSSRLLHFSTEILPKRERIRHLCLRNAFPNKESACRLRLQAPKLERRTSEIVKRGTFTKNDALLTGEHRALGAIPTSGKSPRSAIAAPTRNQGPARFGEIPRPPLGSCSRPHSQWFFSQPPAYL
jgi:hypothetical protein